VASKPKVELDKRVSPGDDDDDDEEVKEEVEV
jgi:hypothetical protein